MSLRSGFKITARDLRVAKFGKKNAQANCGRELEHYLTAIGKVGSEALIAQEIVLALTNCINAKNTRAKPASIRYHLSKLTR